jgi:KDO2-lipid IV(A) lauroyltransferase
MQALLFYLVWPFLYLISILPFPLLYGFSSFVYLILYRLIGYRRKVVAANLRLSFPEKSDYERLILEQKFYRYFCDIILEVVKTFTISSKTLLKHCSFDAESTALLNRLHAEKKNLIFVLGHYGNWEWGNCAFSCSQKHKLWGLYHPLKNRHFDRLMYNMRARFGTGLIPMKETQVYVDRLKNNDEPFGLGFIADQTPRPEKAHWMEFLNQDTPVFLGTERYSHQLNYPVVYISIQCIGRGYYAMKADLLVDDPTALTENTITEMHTRKLEEAIRRQPEFWIWTHKRWKHKRPQS